MSRVLRVLLAFAWLEVAMLLILVPWSGFWDSNYFLSRYPALISIVLNPYLRGAISGLGILNAVLAFGLFRRESTAVAARH
jgi:hypothetical protein